MRLLSNWITMSFSLSLALFFIRILHRMIALFQVLQNDEKL